MRLAVLILLCGALIASPALAGTVSLKADVSDADGKVTLGDLFDGAGGASGVLVANRVGPTVVLDAAAVQGLARRAGLDWGNPQGLRRIVVRGGAAESASAPAQRGNVESHQPLMSLGNAGSHDPMRGKNRAPGTTARSGSDAAASQ